MDDSTSSGPPWGYIVTLGALVIVAIVLLVVPGMLAPKPAPTAGPSPTAGPTSAPLDPHVVLTPGGTLVFGLEDGSIVIRRTVGAATTELGRAALPAAMLPTATDAPINGSASYVMVCPSSNGQGQDRFVFGHLDLGQGITYAGPPADGQGAPDGLFLFALRPGDISDSQQIRIQSSSGRVGVPGNEVGIPGAAFGPAASEGVLQPSGCRIW